MTGARHRDNAMTASAEHPIASIRGPARAALAAGHARAWLLLVVMLAVHVADEALTGFLDFYNPLVLEIRSQVPWFPMPVFTFPVWIAGLTLLVLALAALTPAIRQGVRGTAFASWILALIMLLNGIGHLAGSAYFQRWLPGASSAPLLLIASALLARATWRRSQRARSESSG
jgi:uncharacterized membrane protein